MKSEYFKKFLPYLIILIASLFGSYLVFYHGFPNGDDVKFHFAQIYDCYLRIKNLDFDFISPYLGSGIGIGKSLFYSPIAHLSIAFLGVILSIFNISLMTSFKISIVLSFFLSGIFMYYLALKVSKNNLFISLISSLVYTLWPYRIYDVFHRVAISEAFSFIFIPLFFLGIFEIIHDEKLNLKPFVITIISGALLFLTHNLTAFYTYLCSLIFVLFYSKELFKKFKNKSFIFYSLGSIIILFGLISINLFTQIELLNLDYYVISNPLYMWTNREEVVRRTLTSLNFSGFLKFKFYSESMKNSLIWGLCFYTALSFIFVLVTEKLEEYKSVKPFSLLIGSLIYLILIILLTPRIEIILASVLLIILYSISKLYNFEDNTPNNKIIISSIVLLLLNLILINVKEVWMYLPEIFLKIQFPWRLWTFVQFFVALMICGLLPYLKNRKALVSLSTVIVGILLVFSQGLIEKRRVYEDEAKLEEYKNWHYSLDETYLGFSMSMGANKEYAPVIYHAREKYKSEYQNSLYRLVRNYLFKNDGKFMINDLKPAILEGKGKATINNRHGSKLKGELELDSEALIQLPIFYYPGYEVKVDGKNVEVMNVDGLVSFKAKNASSSFETLYVGTTIRKVSYVYFSLSLISIILLPTALFIYKKRHLT